MKRLYFHYCLNGELIKDPDGAAFHDLSSVTREAVLSVRELVAAQLLEGRGLTPVSVKVVDELGATVVFVPFEEAIRPDESGLAQVRMSNA